MPNFMHRLEHRQFLFPSPYIQDANLDTDRPRQTPYPSQVPTSVAQALEAKNTARAGGHKRPAALSDNHLSPQKKTSLNSATIHNDNNLIGMSIGGSEMYSDLSQLAWVDHQKKLNFAHATYSLVGKAPPSEPEIFEHPLPKLSLEQQVARIQMLEAKTYQEWIDVWLDSIYTSSEEPDKVLLNVFWGKIPDQLTKSFLKYIIRNNKQSVLMKIIMEMTTYNEVVFQTLFCSIKNKREHNR